MQLIAGGVQDPSPHGRDCHNPERSQNGDNHRGFGLTIISNPKPGTDENEPYERAKE